MSGRRLPNTARGRPAARPSPRPGRAAAALAAAWGFALGTQPARAQPAPARADAPTAAEALLGRALDLEGANRPREAAALFRQALSAAAGPAAGETRVGALLGAERVYAELSQSDSVLPLVAVALRTRPADPVVRTVQLRTLVGLRRDGEARDAYRAWRFAVPGDPSPYREFTRLLLAAGQRAAADSVLRDAAALSFGRGVGGLRELAPERAQVLASTGQWGAAAAAWRDALSAGSPYAGAAVYSLQSAPDSARAGVAGALLAPPAAPDARRAAATLLLGWRRPREAWAALAPLPPDSAAREAWRAAADQLAAAEAWAAARDAWTRLFETAPNGTDVDAGRRAAAAALAAGDPAGALALADRAAARVPNGPDPDILLTRVRALGRLGRAADAERAAAAAGGDAEDRAALAAAVAGAWVAQGDLVRARAALTAGGPAARRTAAAGWLALYAGDLRGARALLRRAGDDEEGALGDRDAALTALTVLGRARADSAPAVGAAFLALARGDSARASAAFEQAAAAAPDAAPPLLLAAARVRQARGEGAAAEALWRRVLADHAASPEAAEAELAWARALAARGDRAGARVHLEHLIVTSAESALVPVARRELDALGTTP